MIEDGAVRPEPWITEVLRIKSPIRGITEREFGYSQLYSIKFPFLKKWAFQSYGQRDFCEAKEIIYFTFLKYQ